MIQSTSCPSESQGLPNLLQPTRPSRRESATGEKFSLLSLNADQQLSGSDNPCTWGRTDSLDRRNVDPPGIHRPLIAIRKSHMSLQAKSNTSAIMSDNKRKKKTP